MNLQVGCDYKGWSFFVQFYGVNNVNRSVGLSSLGGTRNTAFMKAVIGRRTIKMRMFLCRVG